MGEPTKCKGHLSWDSVQESRFLGCLDKDAFLLRWFCALSNPQTSKRCNRKVPSAENCITGSKGGKGGGVGWKTAPLFQPVPFNDCSPGGRARTQQPLKPNSLLPSAWLPGVYTSSLLPIGNLGWQTGWLSGILSPGGFWQRKEHFCCLGLRKPSPTDVSSD